MAEEQQLETHDPSARRVELSEEDATYIAVQLQMATQRARNKQHLGTHLGKRLRRSRAVLLKALEQPLNPSPTVPKSLLQRLKDLVS